MTSIFAFILSFGLGPGMTQQHVFYSGEMCVWGWGNVSSSAV